MELDLLSFGLEAIAKRHQARGHIMSHLHLTSLEDVRSVKDKVFPQKPYPNWTAVGVNWLAGFDFEIKVIARIPAAPKPPLDFDYAFDSNTSFSGQLS